MNDEISNENVGLANKIARLVEECGWNQEEFARRADLNRQTVRQILQGGSRNLRNSTISSVARSLGLPVSDLRNLSLEQLLPRMHNLGTAPAAFSPTTAEPRPAPRAFAPIFAETPLSPFDRERADKLLQQAVEPQLRAWIERNLRRASELSDEEIEEILSVQEEAGGHLSRFGVDNFVRALERKRHLIEKVHIIANTEYLDPLEMIIDAIYDKIRPYRDRA